MIRLSRVFPRLVLVETIILFPSLGAGCIFSRAWYGLHVFASSFDWLIAFYVSCDRSVVIYLGSH